MNGNPQQHRKRVDRALARAADRDREGARMSDDVLAVEVRRLRDQVARHNDVLARYRRRVEGLVVDQGAALNRADEWRERALAAERNDGHVDPEEVRRLRAQVAAFRKVVAERDAALVEVRAQLAEADKLATRGGRRKPFTHQWANLHATPAPASAADESAPPLVRGLGPAVRTATPAGEEL